MTVANRKALVMFKHKKLVSRKGNIQRVAYQKKKQEEEVHLASLPDHEKNMKMEKRNEELKNLRDKLAEYLSENYPYELKGSMFDKKMRSNLFPIIRNYIREKGVVIVGFETEDLLAEYMLNEIAGLGPIDELIQREGSLNEIWVNGLNPVTGEIDIYYEKEGKKYKEKEIKFRNRDHVMEIANKIKRNGNQKFGTAMPLANVRYPDGRVNLVRDPVATGGGGPYISFRLFPKETFEPADLVKGGSMNEDMLLLTRLAFKYGLNGLMVGPTGSGKTTLLTIAIGFIDDSERVLLMEDTEEMRIRHKYPDKHIITEETFPNSQDPHRNFDMAYLTKNALRQKPDYMIYGEVRDQAAYDMLNGANTGHKVWCTLHSRSAEKAVQRLINMVLEHGSKMDSETIGQWIAQSIDLIFFQKKYKDNVRRVKEIIELTGYENGRPQFNSLFRFKVDRHEGNQVIGRYVQTGKISSELAELLIDEGAPVEEVEKFRKDPEGTDKKGKIDPDETKGALE